MLTSERSLRDWAGRANEGQDVVHHRLTLHPPPPHPSIRHPSLVPARRPRIRLAIPILIRTLALARAAPGDIVTASIAATNHPARQRSLAGPVALIKGAARVTINTLFA